MTDQERCPLCGSIKTFVRNCEERCDNPICLLPKHNWTLVAAKNAEIERIKERVAELEAELNSTTDTCPAEFCPHPNLPRNLSATIDIKNKQIQKLKSELAAVRREDISEPSREWCESVGMIVDDDIPEMARIGKKDVLIIVDIKTRAVDLILSAKQTGVSVEVIQQATRGDVRRLAEALGITLEKA